jgi:TetR/AcrR family fatty acid metabolism transcriptional regulator
MNKALSTAKPDKEAIIFKAAVKIMTQKGFHKARMSDIAKEANISYGLIYHYFRNKDDLFDTIIHRWWGGLFRLMADMAEQVIPLHLKLMRIISYFLDTYQRHPGLVTIFITEISRSTANLTTDQLHHFKKFMLLTEGVIKEGQKQGILRSDFKARYLTNIFLGAIEAFVSTMVLADQKLKGNAQKERIASSILEVFINGAKHQVRPSNPALTQEASTG